MTRRPGEIADSDGESDIDVDVDVAPSLPQPPSSPRAHQGDILSDIDLGVNFSEFLSQSQQHGMHGTQLSVAQEEHLEGVEKSTGTTASLKRQIESEQRKLAEQKSSSTGRLSDTLKRPVFYSSGSPIVAKTKRRHSELVTTGQMGEGREAKRRREKTYGSSNSRLRSSQPEIFTEEHQHQPEENMSDLESGRGLENSPHEPKDGRLLTEQQVNPVADFGQDQIEQYHYPSNKQSAVHDCDGVDLKQIREPSANADAFNEYMQASSGRVSTSRSLMGNYESINLDFSGNGRGLDINANPFGDASQQPLPGDHINPTEIERPEAIFSPQMGTGDTVPFSSNRDTYTHDLLRPLISGNDGAASLREENQPRLASSRSKSFVDPSVLMEHFLDDSHELFDAKSSSPSRKRRKTADGLASNIASTAYTADSLATTIATPGSPPPRSETQGKKRGRKPKNQNIEANAAILPEQSEGCSEIDDRHAKNPSSELHLEDESTIGLPQEQYKPRPSRSRSKRTAEEEMPPPSQSPTKSIHTPVKQHQPSTVDDMVHSQETDDTPLTKLKKDKRRKNKMKRAKTSAAALLKKSDKMLSDGEEDVVWVDTKPAAVKMKLPDPLEVKREESTHQHKEQATAEEGNLSLADTTDFVARKRQSIENALEAAAETAAEIPQAEEGSLKLPPKKRGRKKKIAVEVPVSNESQDGWTKTSDDTAEAAEEAVVENDGASDQRASRASLSRQALREQDVNTSHPIPVRPTDETISTPQKGNAIEDTHVPLTITESPPIQKQQQPPTPTAQANPCRESNNRGPTKHSPINPTGGKVKYRVGLSRRATIPPLLKIVRK
jgi:hypothetical protein